jgi:predicted regulator of Ras-like GTPase activity (Roadblock/LC7/MglB family)
MVSTRTRRSTHDMVTLPQLIEEDIGQLEKILRDFLKRTEASAALIIDKGGFLITHQGESDDFDLTTIAALSSGAYLANQTIANLVHETNFDNVYQQGEKFSMFISNIDEHCLLVVIFPAHVTVGMVKYYTPAACKGIAAQLHVAHERDPDAGFDLSVMNVAETTSLFKRR